MIMRADLMKSVILPTYLYELRDSAGTLLYVGVTSDVNKRLNQHESQKPWWAEVADLKVRSFKSRATAEAAERKIIETDLPRHNLVHSADYKPGRAKPKTPVPVVPPGMKTYRVEAERGGRFWLVHVPEVDRSTQARNLRELEPMARDLIAIMEEVPEDSFAVEVSITLPDEVRRALDDAELQRQRAARSQRQAAEMVRDAARRLHDDGVPLRDIGQVLGVSYQRAHQLVKDKAA